MKERKQPMRTCVVSREKTLKTELIRVVRTPENIIIVDLSGKANGRGAYLKKDVNILEKAKKSKILERYLELEIPENVYLELQEIIEK